MALVHSDFDKWVAGVTGDIAEVTGYNSNTVRLMLALLMVRAGSGLLIHFILWVIMPRPMGGPLAEDGLQEVNGWRRERHR